MLLASEIPAGTRMMREIYFWQLYFPFIKHMINRVIKLDYIFVLT